MPVLLDDTPRRRPTIGISRWCHDLARCGLLMTLMFAGAGCSWQTESGRAFLVLGIGVVTVNEPTDELAANAAVAINHHRAVGLLLGAGPAHVGLLVGFADYQSIICDPDANVLVETISYADGDFEVQVGIIREDDPAPEERKDHD